MKFVIVVLRIRIIIILFDCCNGNYKCICILYKDYVIIFWVECVVIYIDKFLCFWDLLVKVFGVGCWFFIYY